MILHRYLARAILSPLAAVLGVLVALFASYCAAGFLADAANGLVPIVEIGKLIGLKVLIALEVLLPAALYVSVILGFAGLHADREIAAMTALQVPPATFARAALVVAGSVAVVAGGLSLFVRPWAYRELHAVSNRAATLLDFDQMVPGTFYVSRDDDRVIILGDRAGLATTARDIFVQLRHPDRTEIVVARLGYSLAKVGRQAQSDAYLHDAYVYQFGNGHGKPDTVLQAGGITVAPTATVGTSSYNASSASTADLMRSNTPTDIAERQWRFSTPLSTLLLGLLGIPLSRGRPRDGRYARLPAAMLLYFGYYLLSTSARTWLQHGAIPPVPGIWWVPALLALVVAGMLAPLPILRRSEA